MYDACKKSLFVTGLRTVLWLTFGESSPAYPALKE